MRASDHSWIHLVELECDGPGGDEGRVRVGPVSDEHTVGDDTDTLADAEELDLVPAVQRADLLACAHDEPQCRQTWWGKGCQQPRSTASLWKLLQTRLGMVTHR